LPTETLIRRLFSRFGTILDVSVKEYAISPGDVAHQQGYGFVTYENKMGALNALQGCKGLIFEGISFDCTPSHRGDLLNTKPQQHQQWSNYSAVPAPAGYGSSMLAIPVPRVSSLPEGILHQSASHMFQHEHPSAPARPSMDFSLSPSSLSILSESTTSSSSGSPPLMSNLNDAVSSGLYSSSSTNAANRSSNHLLNRSWNDPSLVSLPMNSTNVLLHHHAQEEEQFKHERGRQGFASATTEPASVSTGTDLESAAAYFYHQHQKQVQMQQQALPSSNKRSMLTMEEMNELNYLRSLHSHALSRFSSWNSTQQENNKPSSMSSKSSMHLPTTLDMFLPITKSTTSSPFMQPAIPSSAGLYPHAHASTDHFQFYRHN
jgi:hypothetical protein